MNETAFDEPLFASLKPGLTSFCYRMLGSMDDADDAVQETSIRVWQSWSKFRQDSSFKTWVYRIASNLCLDKLRQSKRRALPVDLFDPAVVIVEPRDTLPDSAWIWPSPDFGGNPEDRLVRRDTLQLCFIAGATRRIGSSAEIPFNCASSLSYRPCLRGSVRYSF
ncbi:MAG: polymerase, sigma-24 subunit, subfamily [Paenibacillus sp.]|nr:polymerase, sigma-24 subunit, subfamily [Paenibacillus sp.]